MAERTQSIAGVGSRLLIQSQVHWLSMGKKLTTPEQQGDHGIWKAYANQVRDVTHAVPSTPGDALDGRRLIEQVSAISAPAAVAALHRIADALEAIAALLATNPGPGKG